MVEKGRSAGGGSVVIVGAGTLGLLAAAVARRAGYRSVVVADIRPEKLSLASQLGATSAVHIDELNAAPAGADLVIEAVGVEATRRAAITTARPGATVVLLGNAEAESSLPVNEIVSRELVLTGSYSSTDAEFRAAIQLMAGGLIETESWTRVVPLEEGPASFEALSAGRETAKVLLRL
jgi:threonine dehydrogenase-like Zn-dependent dehydrogenase